ncbi:MAG: PKD domain-containing protein [Candidatus Bathyarchaeota archaeon]|nr:PKD domain-containing protein [Candidatus Bathyarchaeota archaeon]
MVTGHTAGNIGVSYQFSASSTDPYGHNIRYTFDWGDGSPQTVTGWYAPGATAYASHSWGSGGVYSVTVKAQCANGAWSSWSSPHFINIGNQQVWLTVDAYDYIYGNPLYPNIYIDGNWAGYGYVSVQVTAGYHSVLVDDPVWNGYLGCYDYLWCFTDGYGNGQNRPVFSNKLITAQYLPSY